MEELLEELVKNFSIDNLKNVVEKKFKDLEGYINQTKTSIMNDIDEKFYDKFPNAYEIAEVKLKDEKLLKVYAIETLGELSERSSKKLQFDLAKSILRKDLQTHAGLFVFYDKNKNFRFSLVKKVYTVGKTEFSHFKRYTYFVEKGKTYRTFIKNITEGDFTTLSGIIEAFSTRPLTDEFYKEIQDWFAWALKHSKFPSGITEENLIRLLARLIFVWFLKEKKLIPQSIFDENFLEKTVKDFKKSDCYYNAILQNLFFATLNRYPKDRAFAKDGSFLENRTDFGVKTLYRYKDKLLISEKEFLKIFEEVPFVNGGLFECLDEDKNYIDGFSRREDKRAKLPDFLFFGDEREEDLSDFYGEKRKAKVRGLINILKDYNFTADESSPIDIEVSLDPELLGHIFENLLASYNPETQTTARKATGSYYTPKEIVDFMVEESLVEYLKTNTNIPEDKLRDIVSYNEKDAGLTEEEKNTLLKAIDSIKIIDPAVGSGAFPMGIVHKLVYILSKIDPENKLWYEIQYNKALDEVKNVLNMDDKEEREKLLKEVNENFDESLKYPDYARKLYVIENSIYGVDIQPIAIQISKLRFFLSLIIDQKVDKSKENFGIKPLPHLETKFVCANTLIGLDKPKQGSLLPLEVQQLNKELSNLYNKFFRIKTYMEKKRIEEKAKKIKQRIGELLLSSGWSTNDVEKIINFDIFSQTAKADWFDPQWMFGLNDGFDIVIGNPPYVRQERIKDLKPILKTKGYKTFTGTADLYVYFFEKGYNLLKEKGVLSYIVSNKWIRAKYGEKLRKFLKENTTLIKLVDFGGYRVFAQTVDTCIVLFRKQKPPKDWTLYYAVVPSDTKKPIEYINQNWKSILQNKLSDKAWTLGNENVLALKEKIEQIGKPLKDWDVKIYFGIKTGFNDAFIIDTETRNKILANCKTEEERKRTEEIIKPVLRGRDIERWRYKWAGLWVILAKFGFYKEAHLYPAVVEHLSRYEQELKNRGQCRYTRSGKQINRDYPGQHHWLELDNNPTDEYLKEFEKEKIVWQEIVREPSFAYDDTMIYCEATAFLMTGENLKYILGILNSKPATFFFRTFYAGGGLGEEGYRYKKAFLEQLPLPPITPQNQALVKEIEKLVDQILSITQSQDYETNHQKQEQVKELERQIDQLVYKLYNLTEEEIKMIEGNKQKDQNSLGFAKGFSDVEIC
ncbi:Eco57I restriction-modification methylase domain-containing protein [Sulfurihydrogenibium sp.]|uniref:Eco57I restriction-modification methylase domain-containing protein n=1 Tax=Sulfurihydrogenibium sp. TaxID=2053621 RepID=UPI002629631E|nr:Eco57I restriction-modification methylase domain-containing protein [Sulfurihydrogenibium sp.]